MSEFVINDETAGLSIGELLRRAKESDIRLVNAEGETVGWIGMPPKPLPPLTEEELKEIRRRCDSDQSNDLTRTELLARLHALTADE